MSDPRQAAKLRLERLIDGHWSPVSDTPSPPEPQSLVRRRHFLRSAVFGALGCAALGQSALANCLLMPTGQGGQNPPKTTCTVTPTITEVTTSEIPSSRGGDSASGTVTTSDPTGVGSGTSSNTTSGASWTASDPGPPPIYQTVYMDFGGAGPVDITGATNFSAGTATTAFTLGSHPSTTVTMTLSATYTTTETCLRGSGGGGQMADIDAEARPAPDSGKSLPLTIEELMRRGPFWKVELGM